MGKPLSRRNNTLVDNLSITNEEMKRLQKYNDIQTAWGESGSKHRLWETDDIIDRQLRLKMLIGPGSGWGRISVTALGQQVANQGVTHSADAIKLVATPRESKNPFEAFKRRAIKHLSSANIILWETPKLVHPKNREERVTPDLFSLRKTLDNMVPTFYFFYHHEATLSAEITGALKSSLYSQAYIVCPSKLRTTDNIPTGFGIISENELHEWHTVKKPLGRATNVDEDYYIKMVANLKKGRITV